MIEDDTLRIKKPCRMKSFFARLKGSTILKRPTGDPMQRPLSSTECMDFRRAKTMEKVFEGL